MTTTHRHNNSNIAHLKRAWCIVHCALAVLLIAGCGNDKEPVGNVDFEEGIPTEVIFSISSHFNSSVASRADGTPKDPENDNEKINDWLLVFSDTKTNTVQKIITRAEVKKTAEMTPVEAETFRFILPSGHYNVYAFANISAEELETAIGLSFSEGSKIIPSVIDWKAWTTELNNWNIDENPIPMSGFRKNIEVKNTIEETFSIEVVRMVAKVEFQFTNISGKKVSINEVSLDPVTTSEVSLFPRNSTGINYDHLGNTAFTALNGAAYGVVSQNYTTPVTVEASTEESAISKSASIYIKESLSNRPYNDNAFTVGLKVTHEDGVSEHQQYNITKDIKNYINRNDWIVIPITLSRYDVSVEALFYPPIGGYPAVLSTTDPDGSQIFTFYTEGEFALVPHVFDKHTGQHLSPQEYTIEIGNISGMTFIFKNNGPTVTQTATSLPDEIIGSFNSNAYGKASIEVKVIIGSQVYTRNIYIIRLNG
ncbi:MAG: hypothetical protein K2K25_08405 [Muribaculaceae bacterium]|nr:hypothetical protein [Muribaculaceae bacterium]